MKVQLYSEDRALLDRKVYTLEVYAILPEEDTQGEPQSFVIGETLIEIMDPCLHPKQFTATEQHIVPDWNYRDSLEFTVNPFAVDRSCEACQPTYTCQNLVGPDGFHDLCSVGNFDPVGGVYTWNDIEPWQDYINYPPGVYEIMITGTLGDATDTTIIYVHIQESCDNSYLKFVVNPFPQYTEYTLGDSQVDLSWSGPNPLLKTGSMSCGEPVFKIVSADQRDIIEPTLFYYD